MSDDDIEREADGSVKTWEARTMIAVEDRLAEPVQSAGRVAGKESTEARRRREIAQWNAGVDAKKRAK